MVGSKLIEKAFNSNQRNASAANALCDIFLRKGQYKRVRWYLKITPAEALIETFVGTKAGRADDSICRHDGGTHGWLHTSRSCLSRRRLLQRCIEALQARC
jgi:hypothetical protein